MPAKAVDVVLIIVDISGYTRFLVSHAKALAHGEMIVSALLTAIVEEACPDLAVAETEGDAVFMYAVKDGSTASAAALGDCLLQFFRGFKTAVADLARGAVCTCRACSHISELRLKAIVHSGPVVASRIGTFARVSGVDGVKEAGVHNVEVVSGYAESLPVPDGWADVVISNGVLNLCPDKLAVLAEMHRVPRPGGRLQVGDILVQVPVRPEAKKNIDLWAGRIAGALLEAELEAAVTTSGFVDFEVIGTTDVFSGAPQQSRAEAFGTRGVTFRARKPHGRAPPPPARPSAG